MILLGTHSALPQLSEDDWHLNSGLKAAGIPARPYVWTGPLPDDLSGSSVLIRSCWDYHLQPDRFRNWLKNVEQNGSFVINGKQVIEWNLDKSYLLKLAEEGVSIPDTIVVQQSSVVTLTEVADSLAASEVVIKPSISLSAFNTWRAQAPFSEEDEQKFAQQLSERTLVVQAFVAQIQDGEYSLVFFDGKFSHAVLKKPASQDFRVQSEFGGTNTLAMPSSKMFCQAERILEAAGGPFTYARVDGVWTGHAFVLIELELIDPMLFLGAAGKPAVAAFVAALRPYSKWEKVRASVYNPNRN